MVAYSRSCYSGFLPYSNNSVKCNTCPHRDGLTVRACINRHNVDTDPASQYTTS